MKKLLTPILIGFALTLASCSETKKEETAKEKNEISSEKNISKINSNNEALYLKCEQEDCGYYTNDGKEIIKKGKYQFCLTDTFTTMARVLSSEKGFVGINKKEEVLFTIFQFDNYADQPSEGTFRISDGDKLGLADMDGNIIIPAKYVGLYSMQQGRSVFCEGCIKEYEGEHFYWEGGKWGAINKNGKIVIPAMYETDFSFNANGQAEVVKNGEKIMIDLNGNEI